jgi:hypothetical protein
VYFRRTLVDALDLLHQIALPVPKHARSFVSKEANNMCERMSVMSAFGRLMTTKIEHLKLLSQAALRCE